MRVGNLTGSISRRAGGIFHVVRNLAINTQQLGHQVTVFGLKDEFTDADLPAWETVPVRIHNVVGPRSFGFSPHLVQSIQDSGIDLLHLHGLWMYPSVASLSLSRRGKLASIVSPHGMLDSWAVRNSAWKKRIAMRLYEGAHLRAAACLQALCESEAASLRALGLRNPIAVIRLGVELPASAAAECDKQGGDFSAGRKVLLFLGRLHPKKGVPNLLRAWAICQKTEPEAADWKLVVAGWDQCGHEALLKRMVHELAIEESVQFPGPIFDHEKDRALRSAEAFVLPSYSEGLPVSVLEAWAWRLPVLMTPQCNLPEGFSEEAAVKADTDVESLAQGLRTLFDMKESDREQMGMRGRRLVQQRFSWTSVAKQISDVYRWVLGGGPRPECVRLKGCY